MLLSKLSRLLHRTSPKTSPKEESSSEVTCVQNDLFTDDMPETEKVTDEVTETVLPEEPAPDTRAHLTSSVPRTAASPKQLMTPAELREARELFSGLSDSEINRLYKKVTQ